MRQLLIVAALTCVVGYAVTASAGPTPKSDFGKLKSDVANEEVIRTLYAGFTDEWNKHDVRAMADRWLEDGDHIEPDGHVAKGRPEVYKLFKLEHDTVFKKTHLTLTVETVWFITQDLALVDGSYEVTGVVLPDGKEIPPRKGHLTSILLHEQKKWWIAASRLMIPVPLPYKKD